MHSMRPVPCCTLMIALAFTSTVSAQWSRDFNDGTMQGLIEYDLAHDRAGINEFSASNVGNALRMQFHGGAGSDDVGIMYDPQPFGDLSALMLIRYSTNPRFSNQQSLLDMNGGLVARFNPDSFSGYVFLINDGGYLQLIKADNGNISFLCGLQDLPDFDPSLDYWLRAEVQGNGVGGVTLRARGWPNGTQEPSFWHAQCDDGSPLPVGAVGLLANEDDDGNGQYIDLDEVTITTPVAEICDNGLDEDADLLIDCADPGCADSPACQCPDPFADFDRDGDVDLTDFAAWQRCFTDTDDPLELFDVQTCHCFDRQEDLDVDSDDLIAFQACASGPAIPANPACDNE